MPQDQESKHSITEFYAALTPHYHLVYEDWNASMNRQAEQLDVIVRESWGVAVRTVLDVSCGIGTQCLGLAALGYEVTASDLSAEEIDRARCEAAERQLDVDFSVADMREAFRHHGRQFDLVISCDNSVPHLLSDADILTAFRQFFDCTRPGGGCLITVRDYEQEDLTGQKAKLYGTREADGVTCLVLQRWESQGDTYDLSMYIVEDRGEADCRTHVMRCTYNAVGITRLSELLAQAGFADVRRIDGRFFQPVLVGTRRA